MSSASISTPKYPVPESALTTHEHVWNAPYNVTPSHGLGLAIVPIDPDVTDEELYPLHSGVGGGGGAGAGAGTSDHVPVNPFPFWLLLVINRIVRYGPDTDVIVGAVDPV